MRAEEYHEQQASCDGLCDVTNSLVIDKNFMRCVTCPFCKKTVDAILTETTIACPVCKVEVKRS